jgi:hypothetical protein
MAEKGLQKIESVTLADGKVVAHERGLVFGKRLKYEEWEALGRQLQRIEGAVQFWIGDWLNYGEARFGEKYAQAVQETTGRAGGTLANLAWVAGRIETSRRREGLHFGHHQAVAPLEPAEQDRILDAAAQAGLTVHQTREAVKDFRLRLEGAHPPAADLRAEFEALLKRLEAVACPACGGKGRLMVQCQCGGVLR